MNDLTTTGMICGQITGLYGDVLQGWALNPAKPDMRLVVEIYIDGSSVAFAKASEFHPNVAASDDFNGFAVQLRESWLAGARTISARVANQENWLDGTIQLPTPSPSEPAPAASQVWHTGGLKVSGWAFDANDPNRTVTVTVRKGTEVVATVAADRLHHALTYKASRKHGFELDLPWALADGQVHSLEVLNDLGQPLSGSPLTLCCWPEGVEALLRNNAASVGDEAQVELLAKVARHQELLLPKSAGFHHYAEWFEVFQKPGPLNAELKSKCGVLIISEGDAQMDAISQLSIEQQRYPAAAIEVVSSSDVTPGLRRLFEQGCDSVVPLSAGDRLAPHALDHLIPLLDNETAWAFGDCDCDGLAGQRSSPWFKPVWDIDLFIGEDVFSPGAIFDKGTLEQAFSTVKRRSDSPSASWHNFLAAVAFITETEKLTVVHLPKVIYHRHASRVTTPADASRCESREGAVAWLVDSLATGASVQPIAGFPGLLRACWPVPEALPQVSIIIPTRDRVELLKTCVEGLLRKTDYPNIEIIIVDNDSSDPETLAYMACLEEKGIVRLSYPHPFNYSAMNNSGVEIARGEYVCLLNNDIEIINKDWLRELISHGIRNNVGAVGAKLLWPNRMVQHGGVVLGVDGIAGHAGYSCKDTDPGYLGFNQTARRISALTAACLLIKKSIYADIGGMDKERYPVTFNDLDICLKIKLCGYHLIFTPFAKLIHAESSTRGKNDDAQKKARSARESKNFLNQWSYLVVNDPHYNPSLCRDTLSGPYNGLSLTSEVMKSRSNQIFF
ncbi:glycosyltransferase family 2 protein [Pseudomonas coleopterorum]|uniref:glycosyltransferase family 2 protein n=1 Tax=Pseudomonas coleopterorum TaxID=1605838 RepID=UPI002A699418|nr:glycosyltransferase family 2 protein [Pseudomonas coleopterorum]MDY1015749.1 glycosyltransferase family 2 protein [Pseudomonas coleopterorum]